MPNIITTALSPKLVRDVIDAEGRSSSWARPHHVVRWLAKPPTRDWLLATYRRRAHAQRRCDALRKQGVEVHGVDIRVYLLERTQATLEVISLLSGEPIPTDLDSVRSAVTTVLANIENAWGR